MGGRAEPPEGAPEGGSGGEDEFRSVVFDESFVRAARIQELSARERASSGTRPIRQRGLRAGLPRQAVALMLLVALAFSAAVYLGTRHPYLQSGGSAAELSITVIPLQPGAAGIPTGAAFSAPPSLNSTSGAPSSTASAAASSGAVSGSPSGSASASASASPSASAASGPFAGMALQDYPVGERGLGLPAANHTAHFSLGQVVHALNLVQQYLVSSSLDPEVLTNGRTDSVRALLAPGQDIQFDASISRPRNDRRHEATGWMVRFDAGAVRLAVNEVRALGSIGYHELDPATLEVVSDHTFVYALSPAAPKTTASASPSASALTSASASASAGSSASAADGSATVQPTVLFTVRREIHYRITAVDLAAGQLELSDSVIQAGPMACDSNTSAYLQPMFPHPPAAAATVPGTTAKAHASAAPHATTAAASPVPTPGPTVDPFDRSHPAWAVCGVLTGSTL